MPVLQRDGWLAKLSLLHPDAKYNPLSLQPPSHDPTELDSKSLVWLRDEEVAATSDAKGSFDSSIVMNANTDVLL